MRLTGVQSWPILGGCLVVLTIAGVALPQPVIGQFGIGYGVQLDRFVALVCGQGLIYLAATALLLRGRTPPALWVVVAFAAAMRLPPLLTPPFLSNDMFRYIWDGWVQAAGINPYSFIPDDAHLAFLRDAAVFPNINRASYAHTIYPPAAEMVFLAASQIAAFLHIPPVLGMKLAMEGFEALAMVAIVRLLDHAGLPRARLLIYAWNPIPVWEFAGSGHVDAIAVGLIAVALLLAVKSRGTASAAALAAAVLTKFLPVILFPALWRRWDWRFAAVFAGLLVLLYLPYLSAGTGVLGFLGGYNQQEGIGDGHGLFLFAALAHILPLPAFAAKLYLALLACLLAGLGVSMVLGPADQAPRALARRFMLLAGLLMLGLSPHFPWYYPWMLIPACLLAWSSTLYLVTASVLLYLNPTHTRLLWPAILFIPTIALGLRDVWAGPAPAEGDQT